MSSVPAEIGGIGSTMQKLRVSPGFDPLKAQVGPEEYFVLSRIDGVLTLREVLLDTGLPIERGVAIITRLRSIGALLLPGEAGTPVPASVPAAAKVHPRTVASITPSKPITPPHGLPVMRARTPSRPPLPATHDAPTIVGAGTRDLPSRQTRETPAIMGAGTRDLPPISPLDLSLPNPNADEITALAEIADIEDGQRRKILALARLLEARDPWLLLGVPNGSDAKTLKRAYFKMSKDIHPDRFYGRQLGTFGDRMSTVFEAVSRAYERLTNPEKSAAHRAQHAVAAEQPQTPTEYAGELFERACALEVSGDALGAMKMFAAAVRIDPQTKYLRRSASCAIAAGQPRTALEHAKKAQSQSPADPSLARLLARAFRAVGKLADAEEVLVMAMALKSENDTLMVELRNDLADVRRLLKDG